MKTFEKEQFAQHLINTAHYLESRRESAYTSTKDMLCQIFEVACETFETGVLIDNEECIISDEMDAVLSAYGEIFDSIVEKLEEILA